MKRTTISECKSGNCGATNPNVVDYQLSLLPLGVQKKLKELKLDQEKIRHCTYCGDIWIEKLEFNASGPLEKIIKIGIDNSVGREGMIWKILE